MKKFKYEIKETLSRIVYIEAETEEKAFKIVTEKYRKGDYFLGCEDFTDGEIHRVKE